MNNYTPVYRPYASERRIGARVSFALVDVETSTASFAFLSTSQQPFSQARQVVDRIYTMSQKWATIEPNGWILDGTYGFISQYRDNGEIGWWSRTQSDYYGVMETGTFLQVTSNIPLHSNSITICFDEPTNNYCTDFDVNLYSYGGGGYPLIKTIKVTGNESPISIIKVGVPEYQRVMIQFRKTNNRNRFPRVCEVLFGELQVFGNDDIKDVRVRYATSLYSENVPSNEVEVSINNIDRRYNIINPKGIYQYLQEGQGINISIVVDGTLVNMGRFYFSSVKSDDNATVATITGYDRFFLLDSAPCTIGTTGTWSVYDAVTAVVGVSGLDISTNIPESVASRTINKCIPQSASCREALRLIAQAAQCICYFSRLDVLTFIQPSISEAVDVLDNDRMSSYPTITDTGLINCVELTVRNEYSGAESVYTASDIREQEPKRTLQVDNPLVYNGQRVANWILAMCKQRTLYQCYERGNPARELEDVVKIYDAYGENRNARTIEEEFVVATGLTGEMKAVTEYGL